MTVREPPPPPPPPQPASPTVVTHSRLAQTDPWVPTPISPDKPDDSSNKDFEGMMQTRVEALERKYQTIIEQKSSQVQQLMQEVTTNTNQLKETNISFFLYLKIDAQQKSFRIKMEKYLTIEDRHRNEMKRFDFCHTEIFLISSSLCRYAEKHKQDMQIWENKYDILKKRYEVEANLFSLIG